MFQRNEQGFGSIGGTVSLSLDQAIAEPRGPVTLGTTVRARFARITELDWVPDLGSNIGSSEWFRGVATCALLCTTTIMLSPGVRPLPAAVPAPLEGDAWEDARAQAIAPLAWGADTGKRLAATNLVQPLTDTPERPRIELMATIGRGDSFVRVLERAGIAAGEAQQISSMVAGVSSLTDIAPGTVMPITLGQRPSPMVPRPLEALDLRARFDLRLRITRTAGGLQLQQLPIAVDRTPLRIQGQVGSSLYRSARAAGVPAKAIESYIRVLSGKLSLERDVPSDARFDIIVEHARAETGETRSGQLLYAGLTRGSRDMRLLPWTVDGRTEWFEASGVGQRRSGMIAPVAGARMSSGFGMRFHPILGYSRFHRGVDYAAVHGTPVYAVTDGVVAFAGRSGGHGNHVRLTHGSGLGTGYSHLSRFAVSAGARVARGQVIGYVGSTGLSTGPHLHFEVYRNGAPVNPRSVSFASTSLLAGRDLQAFRERLRGLLTTPVAGAAVPAGAGQARAR